MLESQKRLSNGFFAIMSLPATAMGLALSIQISALSWLLSTRYNLDIHEIGIVWAAGPLAGIFGQVIIGVISDKAWFWGGRRRPFILIGGVTAALMLFLLPRLGEVSAALGIGNILITAVIVALTLDLSINISFNPTRSIIADVTPQGSARTKGYTWMQTVSGFWGVMSYVTGATLGNDLLIGAGAVLVFVFSVVPTLFITESRELVDPDLPAEATVTQTDWPQLWRIYFAHGFSWIGVQTMFVYIIAFIQQHLIPAGATPADASAQAGAMIGISFAIMSTVGFLLPALVLEPLSLKIGRVRTQAACIATMALGYFLIAYTAGSAMMLYGLMAIVGIGWAAVVSLPFAIMTEKVDKMRNGYFMGIFNLSVVLPQLFVSLVLGSVIQQAQDKNIIFLICGGSLAISAVLWTLVKDSESVSGTMNAPASEH